MREGIANLGLNQGGVAGGGGGGAISKSRISLDLKNVTLKEALNAIVRADGRAMWAYIMRPCEGRNEYNFALLIH